MIDAGKAITRAMKAQRHKDMKRLLLWVMEH